jgi:hypothetical protein
MNRSDAARSVVHSRLARCPTRSGRGQVMVDLLNGGGSLTYG